MKNCPKCQASFEDDALNFCLECGTALNTGRAQNYPNLNDETPTVIRSANVQPTQVIPIPVETFENQGTTNQNQFGAQNYGNQTSGSNYQTPPNYQTNQIPPAVEPASRRSILPVVLLTFFGTTILLGAVATGAYFYLNPPKKVAVVENKNVEKPVVANNASPTPTATPKPSPTPTATPAPTLPLETVEKITEEAKDTLNAWESASENHDLEKHIGFYGDTLEYYYKSKNVPVSKVREDRAKAYQTFNDNIEVDLSNFKVTPDASGNKAIVVFDKEWNFEGTKYSSGKVQQQITLTRIQGEWKITGEKDLKIYYADKGNYEADQ